MATLLASFPNSRIKPRPATSQSDTLIVSVPAGVPTLVAPANQNRTLITLRNTSSADTAYYGYDANIDDQVGPDGGMPLLPNDSVDLQDPGDIYVFCASAVDIAIDQGEG